MDSASNLSAKGQIKKGVTIAKQAIALQNTLMAFRDSVKTYEEQKQYPMAIKETLATIAKIPDFADGYYKLGVLYSKSGQDVKSLGAFKKAKELYTSMINRKDTDRNRLLNCTNLIKIDVYTDRPQVAIQTKKDLADKLYNGDSQVFKQLDNITKADLLSKTEAAIN